MLNPFSRKFAQYSFLWSSNSEWALYKQHQIYTYLYLRSCDVKPEQYPLWQKADPNLKDKSLSEVQRYVGRINAEWYRVRVLRREDSHKYESLCGQYSCQFRIETEEVIDYDIAHIETAESFDCPDVIYDDLVQYAIKKGIKVYDV